MRISDWSSDVCSSDLATFGAYGGLTCFYAGELTRDGIFESLRRRHHYGTTGCRLHLDVRARLAGGGRLFERDPNVFPDAPRREVDEVMMGAIVQTGDEAVALHVGVAAPAPLQRPQIPHGPQ